MQVSYTAGQDLEQDTAAQTSKGNKTRKKPGSDDEAGSQGSDFELDGSDMSDAGIKDDVAMDVETELGELIPSESKRRRRKPPRMAFPPNAKREGPDSGSRKENGDHVDSDGQKKRGRPRKERLSLDERESSQTGNAKSPAGPSDITEIVKAQLALAKTQMIRLRYAAADCSIPNYSGKVSMILSPHFNPEERWNKYTAIATEVDEALMQRGLDPVFMQSSLMRTLLPLFDQTQAGASPAVPARTGSSPRFKRILPADSSSTAAPVTGIARILQSKRSSIGGTSTRGTPGAKEGVTHNLHTLGASAQRNSATEATAKPAMGTKKRAIEAGKGATGAAAERKNRAGDATKGGSAAAGGCFFCSVSLHGKISIAT